MWINVFFMNWLSYRIRWLSIADEVALSERNTHPVEIRKIIYTTNAIEGLNRQFRKVTKTKNVFPNDDSLRKMLYLAIQNLSIRWTQRCRNWDLIINQFRIMDSSEG